MNTLRLLGAALCMVTVFANTRAQFEPEDVQRAPSYIIRYTPKVEREAVQYAAIMAGLSAEQRRAFLDTYQAFRVEFDAAALRMSEYREALESPNTVGSEDSRVRAAVSEAEASFKRFSRRVQQDVEEQLRAQLDAANEDGWQYLQSWMHRSRPSWSTPFRARGGTNLVLAVAQSIGRATVSPGLVKLLQEYSVQGARLEAKALEGEAPVRLDEIDRDPNLSLAERQKKKREVTIAEMERLHPLRLVDNVGLQGLARHLDPAIQARVEERYFGSVGLIDDWNQRALWSQLSTIGALTPEQRDALLAIRSEFRARNLERAHADWKRILSTPPGQLLDEDGQFDTRSAARQRANDATDKALLERLREVLTPEQIIAAGPPFGLPTLSEPRFGDPAAPEPQPRPMPDGRPDSFFAHNLDPLRITAFDVELFVRSAEMGAADAERARGDYAAFATKFDRARKQHAAFRHDTYDVANAKTMDLNELGAIVGRVDNAYSAHQRVLRDDLVANLKRLVGPEQSEAWARFERRVRRAWLMNWPRSGVEPLAAMDLTFAVESIPGDESPDGVRELLLRYEVETDPLISAILDDSERMEGILNAARTVDEVRRALQEAEEIVAGLDRPLGQLRVANVQYFERIAKDLTGPARFCFEEAGYDEVADAAVTSRRLDEVRRSPRVVLAALISAKEVNDESPRAVDGIVAAAMPRLIDADTRLTKLLIDAPKESSAEHRWEATHSPAIQDAAQVRRKVLESVVDELIAVLPESILRTLGPEYQAPNRMAELPPPPNFDKE